MPLATRLTIPHLLDVPPANHDAAWLRQALQWAVELELTTIPPYLCAMWSIGDATHPVHDQLYDIVIKEMFHMALACNMLTTLGATPVIASVQTAPSYPCALPGNVHPGLIVGLDQLRSDPNAIARVPHAAFEQVVHAQVLSDLRNGFFRVLIPHGRRTGDDAEV